MARHLTGNNLVIPPADHERRIPHGFLRELYAKAIDFNETDTEWKATYLASQIAIVADTLSEVNGVDGVFGLGYPFYGFYHDGKSQRVPPVPEISRFIAEKSELIARDAKHSLGAWACAACQKLNQLPDLKTICKPCNLAVLKPREPFKALLDLDFITVVEKMDPRTLDEISQSLSLAGFAQSDTDIYHSLMAVNNAFDLVAGSVPRPEIRAHDHNLPLDIHVIDRRTFEAAAESIARDPLKPVNIYPQSLRGGWVDNPEAVNLTFDFLFSLTGSVIRSPQLAETTAQARKAVHSKLQTGQLDPVQAVSLISDRASRILESPIHRQILDLRINGWQSQPFSDMEEVAA